MLAIGLIDGCQDRKMKTRDGDRKYIGCELVVIFLPVGCRPSRFSARQHFLAFLEYMRHCATLASCRELQVNDFSENGSCRLVIPKVYDDM